MKNKKQKTPKSHLPKYETGGSNYNEFGFNPPVQGTSTTSVYNQKRMPTANQYAAYGQLAMNLGNQLSANNQLEGTEREQANAYAINNTADSTLASSTGWGAAATGASNLGRSVIKRDENGNPISSVGRVMDANMTASHTGAIDQFSAGNTAGGLGYLFGGGKLGSVLSLGLGKQNETSGFWGKTNKLTGLDQKYADGGMTGIPNAEVEKQENTLNPDGSTNQYNGKSHASGGIQTNLDPGTLIFSDKLKLDGKTFAKLNKPNMTNKEDKVLENKDASTMSKLTAQLMKQAKNKSSMDLFQAQEALKQSKLDKYANRLGMNQSAGEFKYGGIKKYGPGGKVKNTYTAPIAEWKPEDDIIVPTNTMSDEPDLEAYWAAKANGTYNDNSGYINPTYSPNGVMMNSLQPLPETDNTLPFKQAPMSSPRSSRSNINWGDVDTQAAYFAANNAGNIYDLARSRKPEVTKFERITSSLVDPTAAIRDANEQTRRAEYNVRGASGGNAGTYLSNRVGLNTANIINKDRIRQQYANTNAGIQNQTNQINTGIANQEYVVNEQNRAASRSTKQAALARIGSNTANQMTDIRQSNMDKKKIDALVKMYPALSKDPEMLKYMLSYK